MLRPFHASRNPYAAKRSLFKPLQLATVKRSARYTTICTPTGPEAFADRRSLALVEKIDVLAPIKPLKSPPYSRTDVRYMQQ